MKQDNDTTVRLSKTTSDKLSRLKDMMQLIDKRDYSKSEVVEYMVKYMLENDIDLKEMDERVKYNIEKGRLYELYKH